MPAKSVPRDLQLLHGTFRSDRQADQPAQFETVDFLEPPSHLDRHALAIWKKFAPLMCEAKLLTKGDLIVFESYCMAYLLQRDAYEAIQTHGTLIEHPTRGLVANPATAAYKAASTELRQLGSSLGLDPASRSRIDVGAGAKSANEFTDL